MSFLYRPDNLLDTFIDYVQRDSGAAQLREQNIAAQQAREAEYQRRLAADEVGIEPFSLFLGRSTEDPAAGFQFAPADFWPGTGAVKAGMAALPGLFYSPVKRALSKAKEKGTGQQYIKALSKEKGATAEASITGLLPRLEQQKKLTSEEALNLVSPLKLQETIKGVTEVPLNPTLLVAKQFFAITDEDWSKMTPYQQQSYVDEIREGGRHIQRSDDTKYGFSEDLNLPGGTNPKEILVQLPTVKDTAPPYSQWLQSKGYSDRRAHFGEYQREYPPKDVTDFTGGHWDEPNVLVHIRTNERDVGGKKALHIEEIQSDWHQQGRKKGYQVSRLDAEKKLADKVPDAPFKKDWHLLGWKRGLMEAIDDPSIERLTWTTGQVQVSRNNLRRYIDSIDARPNADGTFQLAVRHRDGAAHNYARIPTDELEQYVGKEMAEKLLDDATGATQSYSGLDLEFGGEFHKRLYDKLITGDAKKFLKQYGVEPKRVPSATQFDEVYGADGERYYIQPDFVDGQFDIIRGRGDYDENSHQWMRAFSNYEDAIEGLGDFGDVKDDLWYIDITPKLREAILNKGIPVTMLLPETEQRLLA